VQGVEVESITQTGEAIGAFLPPTVSGRSMNIHVPCGRGTEETKLVVAAFALAWLGLLSSSSAAKQHLPLLTLVQTAKPRQQLRSWFWKWHLNDSLGQVSSSQEETQKTCNKGSYFCQTVLRLF